MSGQGFAGMPYDKQGWAGTPGSEPKGKTPGERLVGEWMTKPGLTMIAKNPVYADLSRRIDALLAEQSAGMVLDLTNIGDWYLKAPTAQRILDAIRTQLPDVKVLI